MWRIGSWFQRWQNCDLIIVTPVWAEADSCPLVNEIMEGLTNIRLIADATRTFLLNRR
jgi:hypothetical protein